MPESFDLYLISVEWESENKIRKITPPLKPLEPSQIQVAIYYYDTIIYSKIGKEFYQIAVKSKFKPFLYQDNKWQLKNHLFYVGDDFWIIKEKWESSASGKKYHYCPSVNTVGEIVIGISEDLKNIHHIIKIDVSPNIEGFDFEALKNDFEGELWHLLTLNSSKANIQASEIKFRDKVFRFLENHLIEDFIKYFNKIVKNPKRELVASISNVSFEKVKPIPATFRKIAILGSNVALPSKTFEENFDNYENRYLCFMLFTIHQIVLKNISFLKSQQNKLRTKKQSIEIEVEELNKPYQVVDKKQLEAEIKEQEKRVLKLDNEWRLINEDLLFDKSLVFHSTTILIIRPYSHLPNTFGCWTSKIKYCFITFPVTIIEILVVGKYYEILYAFKKGIDIGLNPKFTIVSLKRIEDTNCILQRNILNRQKQNFTKLEKTNWIQVLNASEKKEQQNQIKTLQKTLAHIEEQILSLEALTIETNEFNSLLEGLLKSEFVKKINFKKPLKLKSSMTYLQNINYRNAQSNYQEILDSLGIDIEIFGMYEQITNYGVREMPQVFELWCLVSIISILENSFALKHEKSDLNNLVRMISPDNKKIEKHIEINFTGNIHERKVTLHYQKPLDGGKRPDFELEISHGKRTIRIILDAKFKNYQSEESTLYELESLNKKYLIANNYSVFVLHPCKDLVKDGQPVKMTNYGGDKIHFPNSEKETYPFHRFGYIMIKPNQTNNLKKIIGMAFEYLLDEFHNAKNDKNIIDPSPEFDMLCLNCGSENFEYKTKKKLRVGKGERYYYPSCECEDCGHEAHLDYCWYCRTKLFKHGRYWDYHKTSAWSIFDIHCPNCGMTVADRPLIE